MKTILRTSIEKTLTHEEEGNEAIYTQDRNRSNCEKEGALLKFAFAVIEE